MSCSGVLQDEAPQCKWVFLKQVYFVAVSNKSRQHVHTLVDSVKKTAVGNEQASAESYMTLISWLNCSYVAKCIHQQTLQLSKAFNDLINTI